MLPAVSGWSGPSTRCLISSASRYSGSASASLPWACKTRQERGVSVGKAQGGERKVLGRGEQVKGLKPYTPTTSNRPRAEHKFFAARARKERPRVLR